MISAFHNRNQRRLRKLNDRIMRDAALEPNEIIFTMAVFSYVLSKIVSKPRFLTPENQINLTNIENALQNLANVMTHYNKEEIMPAFSRLEKSIAVLEKEDPRFVITLVRKGKLKMAATFYAQGMSLGMASEMTSLDKQEILDYAGQTMMFDRLKDVRTIKERLKIARNFFIG
ncbi:MAG: hypothetical protein ABII39_04550 [Candidatus Micrarchaeota archaeon]